MQLSRFITYNAAGSAGVRKVKVEVDTRQNGRAASITIRGNALYSHDHTDPNGEAVGHATLTPAEAREIADALYGVADSIIEFQPGDRVSTPDALAQGDWWVVVRSGPTDTIVRRPDGVGSRSLHTDALIRVTIECKPVAA